jgi:hypothetical protein
MAKASKYGIWRHGAVIMKSSNAKMKEKINKRINEIERRNGGNGGE